MLTTSLLTTLFFALSIAAEPVVERISQKPAGRMSFSKRLNLSPSTSPRSRIVENDRGRINSRQSVVSTEVTNKIFSYVAEIIVGSNNTTFSVAIDSVSATTWVGANPNNPYKSNSARRTDNNATLTYPGVVGNITGQRILDQVTVGPDPRLVIHTQTFAVPFNPLEIAGSSNIDGVLGIAPTGPPEQIPSSFGEPASTLSSPTITDGLFSNDLITQKLVAVSFEPSTGSNAQNGELTWGGMDSTKFFGDIIFSPSSRDTSPALWNTNALLSYGSTALLQSEANFVIDTTALMLSVPSEAFDIYLQAVGAVVSNGNFLTIKVSDFPKLQSLFITVAGSPLELVPDAQVLPRSLNSFIDPSVDSESFILVVQESITGSPTFGQAVLERFYTVLDSSGVQVGFGYTAFTNASVNHLDI